MVLKQSMIMYYEVQRLKKLEVSQRKIASALNLNRRTVKHYSEMSEDQFLSFQARKDNKPKLLERFEEFIVNRLREAPAATTAQVHDWLKECHRDFKGVAAKTVYNYVMGIRQKYHIPVESVTRGMMMQEEVPYGRQAQVDFGVYTLRDIEQSRKRVYFFSMLLSCSRMKYVYFLDKPFTTMTTIEAHEKAFSFFQGIPEEVVYDQDRVLMVNENLGELWLTQEFKAYVDAQKFGLFFCRKSDPQSKGKIENVIGYVKKNFLYGRKYFNLEVLQSEALNWLDRTANGTKHSVTGNRPKSVWEQEVKYLKAYTAIRIEPKMKGHKVRKDNMITFKGNFYSVPVGTYKKGAQVLVGKEGDTLVIKNLSGKIICNHKIPQSKNNKVINNNHRRDNSIKIAELKKKVALCFSDTAKATIYLDGLHKAFPRYIRDQITHLSKLITAQPAELVDQALNKCLEDKCYQFSGFKEVLESLRTEQYQSKELQGKIIPLLNKDGNYKAAIQPDKSSIDTYEEMFNRS